MPKAMMTVDDYLAALDHPLKDGVLRLREAILSADPGISEHIKWNAPSFVYGDDDRVTFRLPAAGGIQLIVHRGVKVRSDSAGFVFDDPSGLVGWVTPDRGVITFGSLDEITEARSALVDLVRRWVAV